MTSTKKVREVEPAHEEVYAAVVAALARYPEMTAPEVLAIAANVVGKLIAMQDRRTMTPEAAMEIVLSNIEIGNREALGTLQ